LAASEHRLKLAMDAAALGIFDTDLLTGRIVWDGPHERIFGFPPGGFDGTYTGPESRVHPDDFPKLQREVEEAREARRHFSCECRVVGPDRREHWIYCGGGFQYDDSGRRTGFPARCWISASGSGSRPPWGRAKKGSGRPSASLKSEFSITTTPQ